MDYRESLDALNKLSEDKLDNQYVTIKFADEFYPIIGFSL